MMTSNFVYLHSWSTSFILALLICMHPYIVMALPLKYQVVLHGIANLTEFHFRLQNFPTTYSMYMYYRSLEL